MLSEAIRFSRVVVIDDVASNLRLLESSLKTFGLVHVKTFSDSAAGLAWLLENPLEGDGFDVLCLSGRGDKDLAEYTRRVAGAEISEVQ